MTYKRVTAEINLADLAHNVGAVRRRIPEATRLMAVVKADGYGHGAARAAEVFLQGGADALGVAICEEGIALRGVNMDAPILILGFTPDPQLDDAVRHGLTQTVFSVHGAQALASAAVRRNTRAQAHIKVDTGMSRLGFMPDGASVEAIAGIAGMPGLDVTGIYTHFATSDAMDAGFMPEQYARFLWMLERLAQRGVNIPVRHVSNSGAFAQTLPTRRKYWNSLSYLPSCFFMDMVRIGILCYGLLPSVEMADACCGLMLRPAMRLVTQISQVKTLAAGVGVSYGHLYRTNRETVIATLPVGYADGYPRLLSNKADVLIRGKRARLVGAICMDQCMADITDIEGAAPGDEVVMIGKQGEATVSADELASLIGTIGYEIVCGVGKRVPREYI